jgi:protein-tyrosine-phosphatase
MDKQGLEERLKSIEEYKCTLSDHVRRLINDDNFEQADIILCLLEEQIRINESGEEYLMEKLWEKLEEYTKLLDSGLDPNPRLLSEDIIPKLLLNLDARLSHVEGRLDNYCML